MTERLNAADEEVRRGAVAELARHPLSHALPLIFQAMGDVSWRVRKEAVEALFLGEEPGLEAVDGLIALLRSSDNAGLRNCAVESLERLGTIAVEPLCRHLNDRDPDLRKFVIDILGSIGSPSCLPLLVQAMDDPDPNVSVGAVENLGKLKDPRAVPYLVEALRNGDLWLKFTVLDALTAIGMPVPLEILAPLVHETLLKRAIFECLGVVGDADAAPLLIEGVQQGPRNAREAAAVGLMRLRGRLAAEVANDAIDAPLAALKGGSQVEGILSALEGAEDQEALVEILGLIGDERCVSRLVPLAGKEKVRAASLRALRRVGSAALPKLTTLFPEGSSEERSVIAYLFGELELHQTVPLLLVALDDGSPLVKASCLASLGRLHPEGGARKVARLLNDPDPEVRAGALEALHGFIGSEDGELSLICQELAGSGESSRRRDACRLLARLGDAERLSRLAKDEDPEVRRAALAAIGKGRLSEGTAILVMGLMDEEPEVRAAAAAALGEAGGAQGVEALILSLTDPDPWVQSACLKALAALADPAALPAVTATARSARGLPLIQALKTVAAIAGENGLGVVEEALADADEEVVEAALEILCAGDGSWIPRYQEILTGHPHWGVRRAFFRAVAQLMGVEAVPVLREAYAAESDSLVKGELEKLLGRVS
ncbi:HEAT repeat domain-containing protein [Geomonas sp. RF6]|uniref:HEAT repeat domain-containing protein n=1 Tax=Geomonas sp. RF6 TaxID=2897342 RepID=UPI001E55196F|nr:HEAT repeat domain-containing protein [Geomonas sp. RF6]UFS68977.1 HEAT repeat domain-containing protein [Geomonas sp. RF6]